MYIPKKIRQDVWMKYDCKCAYCGVDLEYKKMQIDHIIPIYRDSKPWKGEEERGKHSPSNFNPSCARCNKWKSTFSIEQFRGEIQKQLDRLWRDSSAYRMACDFDMIVEDRKPVVFWFECCDQKTLLF